MKEECGLDLEGIAVESKNECLFEVAALTGNAKVLSEDDLLLGMLVDELSQNRHFALEANSCLVVHQTPTGMGELHTAEQRNAIEEKLREGNAAQSLAQLEPSRQAVLKNRVRRFFESANDLVAPLRKKIREEEARNRPVQQVAERGYGRIF